MHLTFPSLSINEVTVTHDPSDWMAGVSSGSALREISQIILARTRHHTRFHFLPCASATQVLGDPETVAIFVRIAQQNVGRGGGERAWLGKKETQERLEVDAYTKYSLVVRYYLRKTRRAFTFHMKGAIL